MHPHQSAGSDSPRSMDAASILYNDPQLPHEVSGASSKSRMQEVKRPAKNRAFHPPGCKGQALPACRGLCIKLAHRY